MERIDRTLKNVDDMTSKIARGEGTVGKLINDDTTVEELNKTIEGVNGYLTAADKIQMGSTSTRIFEPDRGDPLLRGINDSARS